MANEIQTQTHVWWRNQKRISDQGELMSCGRMRGAGLVKVIALIPVVLVLLLALVFAFFEGRKAYWDYRVKEMCERDGGIVVYEKVSIPDKYVDKNGIIRIPQKLPVSGRRQGFEAEATDLFYYEWIDEPIRTGSLAVGRHTLNIIRSTDKKILGSMIIYSRSGGDLPTFAHPSSFSCPDPKARQDPLNMVFVKEHNARRANHD